MSNPFKELEDKAQIHLPEATLQIYEGINKDNNTGLRDDNVDRGSAANGCVRQRWYKKHGYKAEDMNPRAFINFGLGDMTENLVQWYIEQYCVGPEKLYKEVFFGAETGTFWVQKREVKKYKQLESSWRYEDDQGMKREVVCHFDGFGRRHDGVVELIEIKSSSNYPFKKFMDESDVGDYLNQAHSYMMTDQAKMLEVDSVRFFYLKKETGHIHDHLFQRDEELEQEVIRGYKDVHCSAIPDRPKGYGFSKKGTLDFPCTYCGYKTECLGEMEKSFKKDWATGLHKPTYVKKKG